MKRPGVNWLGAIRTATGGMLRRMVQAVVIGMVLLVSTASATLGFALAGCVAGVVAGNLLAVPVLHQSSAAYGVGSQQVPWWASVIAPAGCSC